MRRSKIISKADDFDDDRKEVGRAPREGVKPG